MPAIAYTAAHVATLRDLLAALRAHPHADRIRVFGSAAKPEARHPNDIDCLLDLDTPAWAGGARRGLWRAQPVLYTRPEDLAAANVLLALARQARYRQHFDCFVRAGGELVMPNATATWWTPVPDAPAVWEKARTRGVTLDALRALPDPDR